MTVAVPAVLILALSVQFALSSQAQRTTSAVALAVAGGFAAALGAAAVAWPARGALRSPGLTGEIVGVLVGALAWFGAPLLAMSNRYSDAPPGSEVLWLTTSAWGALLGLAIAVRGRDALTRIGGAVLALGGAAAVVANWERPSSFSLFVRYAREEAFMLVAGLGLVLLVVVLARAARSGTFSATSLAAAAGALVASVTGAFVFARAGALALSDLVDPGTLVYASATAFVAAGIVLAVRTSNGRHVALAYLVAPIAVSAFIIPEQFLGPLGPQPLVVVPMLGGALALMAGAWSLTSAPRSESPMPPGIRWRVALAVSWAAVVAALVSLGSPALEAAVRGVRADGSEYRAVFELWGYESAGAWIVLGLSLVVLGVALAPAHGARRIGYAVLLPLGAVAWRAAASTPLRTLTRFVPSDVQVDYGSEFATIAFEALEVPLQLAAVAGALVAGAIVLVSRSANRAPDSLSASRGDGS